VDALQDVEQELEEAARRARALVDGTEARLFTVRPNPRSWSAAECLSHLSISTEMFLPVLKKAIEDARAKGTKSGAPKMDLMGRVLRWFLEPPIRSRVKTTAPFVPRSVRAKSEALAEFATLQQQLKALLREMKDFDLSKMKIVSPFDKRVRYNVYSAYRIITAHQRRHLWQAEQAVASLRAVSTAARA
jgi:DinB superfamily